MHSSYLWLELSCYKCDKAFHGILFPPFSLASNIFQTVEASLSLFSVTYHLSVFLWFFFHCTVQFIVFLDVQFVNLHYFLMEVFKPKGLFTSRWMLCIFVFLTRKYKIKKERSMLCIHFALFEKYFIFVIQYYWSDVRRLEHFTFKCPSFWRCTNFCTSHNRLISIKIKINSIKSNQNVRYIDFFVLVRTGLKMEIKAYNNKALLCKYRPNCLCPCCCHCQLRKSVLLFMLAVLLR